MTKKGRQLFGGRKVHSQRKSARPHPDKILATCMRKGPRLTLQWGPRIVNPALSAVIKSDLRTSAVICGL